MFLFTTKNSQVFTSDSKFVMHFLQKLNKNQDSSFFNAACPLLLFEPTLPHVLALLQPDNLTVGFPASKSSVWAALWSWDVQGHVQMRWWQNVQY